MDYHKKYLEYKKKYYLLKQQSQSQVGGMDPTPPKKTSAWGSISRPSAAPNPDLASYKIERAARIEEARKAEEARRVKEAERAEKARIIIEAKEAERLRIEAEERSREEERLVEERRKEAEKIILDKKLETFRLPPELIEYIMNKGGSSLENLIAERNNPKFTSIVDNYILEQLSSNSFSIEIVLKIYNLIPELQDKMKPIILNNIMYIFTSSDLLFIFENVRDEDFRGAVLDGVCRKDISTTSLGDLLSLYKIIQRKSILDLIKSKIESGKMTLSELIKLYFLREFRILLEPIIDKVYDNKFKDIPTLFNQHMRNYNKLLYIVIHFLCNRLISLKEIGAIDGRYSIDIEFIGGSSIVRGASNFTYSFYELGNSVFKQRIGWADVDSKGGFNFNNLLKAIIYELENRIQANVGIKSISLVKNIQDDIQDDKQDLLKFNFN